MTTAGLVTIGQSPRNDIVASMFGTDVPSRLRQAGALDLLDDASIDALVPSEAEHLLVSRLRDGREVVLAKPRVLPHLQRAIDRVVGSGAGLVVVLCTGTFDGLWAPVPIIYPDRLLAGTVNALLPSGTLGVLMPHKGQADMMRRKWSAEGRPVVLGSASPYTHADDLAERARDLVRQGAIMIAMDCMGYTRAMKQVLSESTSVPTILANRLVGRIIEEILE